jgi:CheY-like chemotaxis protein
MVRNLANMILEAGGYVVLEARDEIDALALCAGHQGPIDLLVTDLITTELGGPELAARAIRLRPGLKVLFLFEPAEEVILKKAVSPATTLLQKPLTPVGLAEKVYEALHPNVSAAGQT